MKKAVQPNWFLINNTWYHCVVVVDRGVVKHYLDGKIQPYSIIF